MGLSPAIPGIAGLEPTIQLIKKSKKVLLANKESIICGWDLINKNALKYKTKIIPIDSEHFSIMKLLDGYNIKNIKKIYLTASGGPFLYYDLKKFKHIKPNQALKHPKWKMGKKISIDSATLMNKILESVEAQKLFSISGTPAKLANNVANFFYASYALPENMKPFLLDDLREYFKNNEKILNEEFRMPINRLIVRG